MAGDWIKMRTDLDDDPAVVAIAGATGLDELAVIGRLWKLWKWANTHTENGDAPSVTEKWIDRYLCADGFARAAANAGWLVLENGVHIPKFDRHNGQSAKARALTKTRMKRLRDGESVTPASPEKRREEKKKTPPPEGEKGGGGILKAIKARGVVVTDGLEHVTPAMIDRHKGKTGGLLRNALLADVEAEREAGAEAENTAAWLSQRAPEELDAIDADAKRGYPADSIYQTNGKIRETRAWKNAVARAMAGQPAGGNAQ